MAIPQQVRQRSQQVEEMMKAQQAQPAEQPEADDEQDAEQSQVEERAEEQDGADDEFVIDHPDDVAKQLAELRSKLEESDQRYKTLQGMARHKEDENQRLQMLLSQMAEHQNEVKQQPQQAKADPGEDKDKEDFGEDFVDMVYRAIDRRLAKFEERLGKTEGLAKQSHESNLVTRQERFEARLTERVPNWRQIDVTEDFKHWLNDSNTRLEIVRKGMANYDANAIAEIFELYTQLNGKGQQQAAPAEEKLKKQVAPSKGRTSKPSSAPEKRQWTRSEIAQVFNNRRGYDQKEFDRLQRDIFAAQKEGRVDYTR